MRHARAAFKALAEVIKDKNAPPSARVTAASAILDRAYGKPAQVMETPDGKPAIVAIERIIITPTPDEPGITIDQPVTLLSPHDDGDGCSAD